MLGLRRLALGAFFNSKLAGPVLGEEGRELRLPSEIVFGINTPCDFRSGRPGDGLHLWSGSCVAARSRYHHCSQRASGSYETELGGTGPHKRGSSSLTVVAHSVVALPCGLDPQVTPFGIRVVGPMYADRFTLDAAHALEQLFAADASVA